MEVQESLQDMGILEYPSNPSSPQSVHSICDKEHILRFQPSNNATE